MFLPAASRLMFEPGGSRLAVLGDALSMHDGKEALWTRELDVHDMAWFSSPAALLVGTKDGHICWLDPATGATKQRRKVDSGPVWVAGSSYGQAAAMTEEGILHRWINDRAQEPLELAMATIVRWLGGRADDMVWIEQGGKGVHWAMDTVHGESWRRGTFPEFSGIATHGTDRFLVHPDRVEKIALVGSEWKATETWPCPDSVMGPRSAAPKARLLYILAHDGVHLVDPDGESHRTWPARNMTAVAANDAYIAVSGPRMGAVFSPRGEAPSFEVTAAQFVPEEEKKAGRAVSAEDEEAAEE